MPDDEPLDDARAVGMAAAAATAKVVETAARAAADRQDRSLRQVRHDPAAERRLDELAAAERWAASQNPDRLHHYYAESGTVRVAAPGSTSTDFDGPSSPWSRTGATPPPRATATPKTAMSETATSETAQPGRPAPIRRRALRRATTAPNAAQVLTVP